MKNELLNKGIILPSGIISKDKINLIAGVITQPFAEMVWVTTGGNMEILNRLTDILVTMNTPAQRRFLNPYKGKQERRSFMPFVKQQGHKKVCCKRRGIYIFSPKNALLLRNRLSEKK